MTTKNDEDDTQPYTYTHRGQKPSLLEYALVVALTTAIVVGAMAVAGFTFTDLWNGISGLF